MTKLLDQAIELVRDLPVAKQDAIAVMLLDIAGEQEPEPIPAEHAEAIAEGLAQADRGEFASDEDVEAALLRFRR